MTDTLCENKNKKNTKKAHITHITHTQTVWMLKANTRKNRFHTQASFHNMPKIQQTTADEEVPPENMNPSM